VSLARTSPCSRHRLHIIGLTILTIFYQLAASAQLGNSSAWQTAPTAAGTPISVSGQVVNAITGVPVSRALVRLNDRATLSDHEGKFMFDQYSGTGSGNLQVTKPGFYLSTEPTDSQALYLQLDQRASPILVRLYPESLLTGTITAPNGEPLPHILVMARRSITDEVARRWIPVAQVQTDSHGNFRLPVPSGDYKLETRYSTSVGKLYEAVLPISVPAENQSNASGFSNTIHLRSGEEQHFDLHPITSRAYTVTARLESASERNIPGITARSSSGILIPVDFQRTSAGNEGRIQLPSGTYTLTASMSTPEGSELAETTVTVPDHDVSGVILRLTPSPSIPIELVVDQAATSDKSPPNVQQLGLTLQSNQIDPDRGTSIVGPTMGRRDIASHFNPTPGSYRLQARNNSEWYVKAASYGVSDLLQQDLVAAPGSGGTPIRVTVSNQTATLQGTVKLSGVPAPCWVYMIPMTPSAVPFVMLRSGANGTYNAGYLPPGSYQVIAFEHRHSADYRDPNALTAYTTHVHSITVASGDKSTLDLDAVTAAELTP
jgi:hypothetical protein